MGHSRFCPCNLVSLSAQFLSSRFRIVAPAAAARNGSLVAVSSAEVAATEGFSLVEVAAAASE